ncbi:MAG: ABC transporter ATP-binding protein [Oscillospiraceae bacterium]|jgi:ATP-binding cassette subfamily B protein|nr:ABC transporter ATP-binding protein [Oscillospiraceae bacterium]
MFQIKWIWENMKGYRGRYILALFMTMIGQIMYLTNPIFGRKIVDTFIYNDNAAENLVSGRRLLIMLCLGMVVFTLVRTVIQFSSNMLYEVCSQGMLSKIRNYLFANVQKQDMTFYDRSSTGDIMTRLSGDLDMVRHSVAWIIKALLESIVLFTTSTVYFFILDPVMAICLLALTPLIFIISGIFRKDVGPKYVDLRERLSKLNTAAQENIAGNRVVRAFAREDYEIDRFSEKNKEYSEANKNAAMTWLKYFPYIETTAQGLTVVQLIAGGIFVITGRLTMGEYVAFSGLIWSLSNPMRNVGALINDLQRFMASASKIVEVYYSRPFIVNRSDAKEMSEKLRGGVEFKNVSFSYDGTPVLKDVSFKINAGETVAIMGETGSGKTTLVNMIPRLYDPKRGEVLVDGVNVRFIKLETLRRNIGMAMQDVLLWSDTIDGNIAFGNSDMPEEDVHRFAHAADADNFIANLSDGYETIVGERGVGLSGGQKQRISLARALAVRPAILILDDTTSAVDLETEKRIQENLAALDFKCTKIIIAQRISSAKDADKIIILKDGKISETGTHEELLKNENGYYSEIYRLQQGSVE